MIVLVLTAGFVFGALFSMMFFVIDERAIQHIARMTDRQRMTRDDEYWESKREQPQPRGPDPFVPERYGP